MDVGVQTREFSSTKDCYQKIVSKEGLGGLYRGMSISLVGVFAYRALYFGLHDSAKHVIRQANMQGNFFLAFFIA